MKGIWKKLLCGILILSCVGISGCGKQGDTGSGTGTGQESSGSGAGAEGASGESGEKTEASGSGGTAGNSGGTGGYMDIQSETQEIFVKEDEDKNGGYPVGMQYYQGEPIQLWGIAEYDWEIPEDANVGDEIEVTTRKVDIYLYRMDGSRELLLGDLSSEEARGEYYLAQDGSIYIIRTEYGGTSPVSTVIKKTAAGEEVYSQAQSMSVDDICQLGDGRIFLVLDDNGGLNGMYRVGELNPDTGVVTELSHIRTGQGTQCIGAGADKLLLLDTSGGELREVDPADGSAEGLIEFSSTTYNRSNLVMGEYGTISDFRVSEDGSLELLRSKGSMCTMETLRMQEVTKVPIVVRGYHFNNAWIKNRVAAFNKSNEDYQIVLQEPGENDDWDDFATQTSVQIATGKGPDLLYGTVISDYVQGMIDKGGFEDLKPYMDGSGIKEEDYFPSAFMWRQGEKIYGINVSLFTYRYNIDASVLGEGQEMNIENLVNGLYSYPEKAMYMLHRDSGEILEMFLQGTEDLWGMIDWEEGNCDFGGELFARMLDVAKRYAYDENQDYPILADRVNSDDMLYFDAPLMQERDGTITAGVMFDDGCYPAMNYTYQIFAINTNSSRKEGAWEFIRFLLGEESQMAIIEDNTTPIQKNAFEAYIKEEMAYLEAHEKINIGYAYQRQGKYVEVDKELRREDVTEEWLEAFRQAAEDTRPLPQRTAPLLDIILEEAADYFNGVKGIEEVVSVIENRVQLYLDENDL